MALASPPSSHAPSAASLLLGCSWAWRCCPSTDGSVAHFDAALETSLLTRALPTMTACSPLGRGLVSRLLVGRRGLWGTEARRASPRSTRPLFELSWGMCRIWGMVQTLHRARLMLNSEPTLPCYNVSSKPTEEGDASFGGQAFHFAAFRAFCSLSHWVRNLGGLACRLKTLFLFGGTG